MLTESLSSDEPNPPAEAEVTYFNFSATPTTSVGEIHFGNLGPRCIRNGWSVFPQERDGRRPGIVDGEMLKWTRYQIEKPSVADVDRWARQAWTLNVAAVMGRASSNTFAIDIDVTDVELSFAMQEAAIETLGATPFQRIGNFPKIALIYRVETADELPANRTLTLTGEDGAPSAHQIEIQGHGKALTIHGRHHKTGNRFQWTTGKSPSNSEPELAPIVTAEMIVAFLDAAEKIRPFVRRTCGNGLDGLEFVVTDGVRKPSTGGWSGGWTRNADGLVVDGRETFLRDIVFSTVRENPSLCATPSGIASLRKTVLDEFTASAVCDGRWKGGHLGREVADKVRRAARELIAGNVRPSARAVRRSGAALRATPEQQASVAHRAPEKDRIAAEMHDRADAFWCDTLAYDRKSGGLPPFHLLKSPVGTGKTTVATSTTLKTVQLEAIAERKAKTGLGGTVFMLTPSHANVDEVVEKAVSMGLKCEAHRGQGHPLGGCVFHEKVQILNSAGISAAKLCTTMIDKKPVHCPHHPEVGGDCERLIRMARMLENDLVVSVHSYAQQNPPEAFKDALAIIVDEDLTGKLLQTATISRALLNVKRRAVAPTKDERKARWGVAKLTKEDLEEFDAEFEQKRQQIVRLCCAAWDAGLDPAREIAGDPMKHDWLQAARTIASRGSRISAEITPATTLEEAVEHASRTTGQDIRLEAKLWSLLTERVEDLEAAATLVDNGQKPFVRPGRDDRIWPFRDDAQRIQISWSSEYALKGVPTLFMDASANPSILAKTLGRKPHEITCRPVQANLNVDVTLVPDHTFSKRKFLLEGELDPLRAEKAALLADTRRFISKVSAVHGDGGCLFVAPKAVEELIHDGWHAPANTDSLHFGHVAGFDWAKSHSAAVLIGAMYPDLETVDGLVAALTYRDEEPVERMDPEGRGKVKSPFDVVEDRIPMRDGSFEIGTRLTYRSALADDVLTMLRDEQLVQALGRLRVVFRDDIPRLYILGNTVPRGLVVDRISTMQAEMRDFGLLLAAAHEAGGIIDADSAAGTALVHQHRLFEMRMDADQSFAKSFHRVDFPTGKRFWICGYVSDEDAGTIARKAGGRLARVVRQAFERPPAHVEKAGPSADIVAIVEKKERLAAIKAVPLKDRIAIIDRLGADAEDELAKVGRSLEEAWRIEAERDRQEHPERYVLFGRRVNPQAYLIPF